MTTEVKSEEVLRREEITREGAAAIFRLIRRDGGFSVSVECGGRVEEISAFPGGEADARLLFSVAVREFVLPGTLADVWRDLHVGD